MASRLNTVPAFGVRAPSGGTSGGGDCAASYLTGATNEELTVGGGVEAVVGGFVFDPAQAPNRDLFFRTFETLVYTAGVAPESRIRLYDRGAPLSPTAGTLVAELVNTSVQNNPFTQVSAGLLLDPTTPSLGTIVDALRMYEIRALFDDADSLLVRWAGLEIVCPGTVAPTNIVAPLATGTVEIGQVLSVIPGVWAGAPTSYTYQWQRDGVDIVGETSTTYTVVAADIGPGTAGVGTGITCLVTATNAAGSSAPTPSNALVFDDATYLPATTIGVSSVGVTLVGAEVDEWDSSLGGIATTLTAPSASQRPLYSPTGGPGSRPLITGDGVTDALLGPLTKGSAFDDYEWGGVARLVTVGAAGDRVVCYGVGVVSRFHLNERNAGTYRITVSGGANVEPLLDSTTALRHWSGDAEPTTSTINMRRDGVVEATAAPATVTSRPDGETLSLFADGAGTTNSNSELMAFYCGPYLTPDQRTHLRALLTYHTGVAC